MLNISHIFETSPAGLSRNFPVGLRAGRFHQWGPFLLFKILYPMKARRQTFVVRYTLGSDRRQKRVIAISGWGAIFVINALHASGPLPPVITSVEPSGTYYGPAIEPDPESPGDF